MKKVLIMYHPNFISKGKFERKLSRIFSNINGYEIVYIEDYSNLISNYFTPESISKINEEELINPSLINLTHAIFFDSVTNPIFNSHYENLDKIIPVRYIKDKITFVSNKDKGEHFDTYIGRGTLWGNPYAIGQDGDRDEVIRKFEYDFERDYLRGDGEFKNKLKSLRGHILGCHCKPYACHGDILAKYLNEIDDGE